MTNGISQIDVTETSTTIYDAASSTSQVRVTFFSVQHDGSGASANIDSLGLRWSFDMLGNVRANRIDGRSVKPSALNKSKHVAEKIFSEMVANLGAEWLAMNVNFYKDVQ